MPDVPFVIAGEGQLAPLLSARPANVEHVPWIEYRELPEAYRRAGCALGIFDAGAKAARVIPNKVFQALACARPVITADTPAARELLTDGQDALLVPAGDPPALATAIRRMVGDRALADRLGVAGRLTYEERASESVLVGEPRCALAVAPRGSPAGVRVRTRTSWPSQRSASTRCDPMNPAPPVTSILICETLALGSVEASA